MQNKYIILILLLSAGIITQLQGQSICVNITASLNEDGFFALDPQEVLNPTLSEEYDATVNPAIFTCQHVGKNIVEVNVVFEGDTVYHCFAEVTIREFTPTAICVDQLDVMLDINGGYKFTFDELDAGSYSQCGNFGYMIEPSVIMCGAPNPVDVKLIIRDRSDNYDTCIVEVHWEEHPGPYAPFACKTNAVAEAYFGVNHEGERYTLTSYQVLEGSPLSCPENYTVAILENGIPRPLPTFTLADTNNTLVVIVTEHSTGAQCTTPLTVVGTIPCEELFFVCDTLSRCAPLGDCSSGHTDQDYLEWPCDIVLTNICYTDELVIDPEAIMWFHYGEPGDAEPTYTPGCDGNIFHGYWDKEIPLPGGKRIERSWTVLNWATQLHYEFIQVIDIHYDTTQICDILPWNAPIGDCDSGHTLTDDIEWPADITVSSFFTHPDDLAVNPNVLTQDVRPQTFQTCNTVTQSYQDFVSVLNDSSILVERTWTIIDFVTNASWSFTQRITALYNSDGSLVCVTRESGESIPGVELIPGVITDATGCHVFENPDGIIVTPVKDSPLQEGVTILDEIILIEYLLGIRPLSVYQKFAADLNQSSGISTIDFVEIRKLRAGTLQPVFAHSWKFFEQNTHESSVDISNPLQAYKFIGVKMGDLDNSFVLTSATDREDMFLLVEDEVFTNDETYQVRFYPDRNDTIVGFAVKIINENGTLDFTNVTAPLLPGFDPSTHVKIDPIEHSITIEWIAPHGMLSDGVPMSLVSPLFFLHVRANEDVLLHEEITLQASFDNVLKPVADNPALDVHLIVENIINSVITLDNGRSISFYPNPATDVVHIEGLKPDEPGNVMITDVSGRVVMHQALSSTVDLHTLHAGIYYISFTLEGKTTSATPLLLINH